MATKFSALLGTALLIGSCGRSSKIAAPEEEAASGAIITMYGVDDLTNTVDFVGQRYGHVCKNGSLYNRRSILGFHRWKVDCLSAPCEGGVAASFLELGDLRDSKTGTTLFHAFSLVGDSVVAASTQLKPAPGERVDTHGFPLPSLGSSQTHVPIHVGSLYLVHVNEHSAAAPRDYVVLLRVIAHVTMQSVTIRWRIL